MRWLSFLVAATCLALSFVLAWRLVQVQETLPPHPSDARQLLKPTFRPVLVPGSTPEQPHATTWDLVPIGPGVVQFYIGLDGLNIWLVVLTGVLMLPAVLVSWRHITERVHEFFAWLLLLQTAMLGIFLAFDIVLFYVFFELSLVPLFFLIGIWGGPERRHAARKFFIYTLAGSVLTLLGVIAVVLACYERHGELTFSLPRLVEIVHSRLGLDSPEERAYWGNVQFWVFLALTAGFAVKVPLVPLHTWLPLAHVEAPTAGSVDLAGVLLKVGAYGFLRLCVPLAPDASLGLGLPLVTGLAAIGVLYGAYCAYSQDDIKKLVAYSSVSHLGVCMLGMFALNVVGVAGSLMQMVNHGLSTAGLFLLVGMLYERYHTRKISDFGGLAARLPLLGCFMVFICLSSVGLPGLNGFIGEALVLLGIFEHQWARGQFPWLAVIGASGMVLGAWYLMTMLQRVFFGPVREPTVAGHDGPSRDLSLREVATLAPVAILCVVIGVYPQPMLDAMRSEVQVIADIAQRARERMAAVPAVAERSFGPGEARAEGLQGGPGR
ncbi:MAG: NADH-quinone oxidoreductase subunit M [Gemmataceae bacterium]|nr:NADH-quinone oxidoreductase subunit M [Gemmataceae bacterium]